MSVPQPLRASGLARDGGHQTRPIILPDGLPPSVGHRPPYSRLLAAAQLTDEQESAVRHIHGPLLVFASAGTGKTTALTYRVAYLIEQELVWPQRIAAITFTRRAADEMRSRLVRLVGARAAAEVVVATTHSLCWRIVRAHAEEFGRNANPDIYDPPRVARVARAILRDPSHRDLARLAHELDEPEVESILGRISMAKNRLWNPQTYLERSEDAIAPLVAPLWELLDAHLRAANAFDFDDLLCCTAGLFQARPAVCAFYAERYEQLHIDEYQDLNEAQISIVKSLKSPGGHLAVFADDDQALYRFRGADPENVLRFPTDFPGTRTIVFTRNFRCRKEVLDAALRVIERNQRRQAKALEAVKGPGGYVAPRRLRTETVEAGEIADTILAAIASGRKPREILVLCRARRPLTRLQPRLVERGIKVRLVGGQSMWERSEIKDAIAYLHLLANPYDVEAFTRALCAPSDRRPFSKGSVEPPSRGAGDATTAAIVKFAAAERISLLAASLRCTEIRGITRETRARVREFAQALEGLRAIAFAAADDAPSLASIVDRALRMPGGVTRSYELLRDRARDGRVREDANRVLEDLRSLTRSAGRYEEEAVDGEPSLIGFLGSLGAEESYEIDAEHDDRVSLMTIHAAKGVEADTVLLIATEEGVLPDRRDRSSERGLEDERRLFFTAVTRARDTAVLMHVDYRDGEPTAGPSRFIAEAGLSR